MEELEKFDEIKKKIKNNIKDILNKMGSTPQQNPQELQTAIAPAHPIIIIDDPPHPTTIATTSRPNQSREDPSVKSKDHPIVIDDGPSPKSPNNDLHIAL